MNYSEIGSMLTLLIIMFFLFTIGKKLGKDEYIETFFPWTLTIVSLLIAMGMVSKNDILGFLGFIPIITYIIIKMLEGMNFSYESRKKIGAISFSIIGSVLNYLVVHTVFGFGIPEASISAIATAIILGSMGYTA